MTKDSKGTASPNKYYRIFERYLAICNQALDANKDKFPYKEIWQARSNILDENNSLPCAVYDAGPKATFILQFTKSLSIRLLNAVPADPKEAWRFDYSFLRHVVDHSQEYIDQPAKLEWGWLGGGKN